MVFNDLTYLIWVSGLCPGTIFMAGVMWEGVAIGADEFLANIPRGFQLAIVETIMNVFFFKAMCLVIAR